MLKSEAGTEGDRLDGDRLDGRPTEFYVNTADLATSIYDIQIDLGVQHREGPETRVRLHMSPQFAYVLQGLIAQNLRAYEANVGPILLPEAALDELGLSGQAAMMRQRKETGAKGGDSAPSA